MSQVSFRIDDQLKTDGERLFKSMGMNMSVAITVFIQQSLQRGKLPFEVVGDPFYSDSNMRELERRAREMDARKNVAEHELLEAGEPVHASDMSRKCVGRVCCLAEGRRQNAQTHQFASPEYRP